MPAPQPTPRTTPRGLPLAGWFILLLTAALSILWSSHKLLEQDEIFSLQTDRVSSLAEVLRIQRLYPISLEPPPYHVLAHAAMAVFGPTAFALRLPALAGFLLMQLCLFFFVRNLIGASDPTARRAGIIAMALPALTWTLFYSAEGRPYGLLLGSWTLAVLCWQIAARRDGPQPHHRLWPLLGLAASLALTLNVHFYGVLLLVPLCGAELLRLLQRRRLDLGILAALSAGTASLALTLPYIKASGEFKKHYYAAAISPHMLTQPYRQMLLNYTTFPQRVQTAIALLLVLAAAAVAWSVLRLVRRRSLAATAPEALILALLLLMPGFAFLLGKFVTHALEVRHSIGAVIAIVSLVALALTPLLRSRSAFATLLSLLLLAAIAVNLWRARESAAESSTLLASLTLTPAQQAALAASPDHHIYFQDLGEWETASLYTPDPGLRSHLVLLYSLDREMRYQQHDTMYLTALHTQHFSTQPIAPYASIQQQPGEHLFATYHSGWSWTDAAFASEADTVRPLGGAFGGDLVAVRFKPNPGGPP